MRLLSSIDQPLHLPHFHLHHPRRRQRSSADSERAKKQGSNKLNITQDDVIDGPATLDPAGRFGSLDSEKTYRTLPIVSGLLIPFSIMLAIPGLTGHWYIRTQNNVTTETRQNSVLLDVVIGFSIASVVLANAFLVIRFSERGVKLMTLAAIAFLTLHDLLSIPAVTAFGITHRHDDGFTYGQSFWFTVFSTVVSTVTNITLILDYVNTKDFARSGSGLTHKQRSLVIVVIVLLSYISFGSLVESKLLDVSFIDALYFSVVTIETIGYGDISPVTTSAKIFTCFYIAGGIMNIALAVVVARVAILESAVAAFRQRILLRQNERRLRSRWRAAVRWRLRGRDVPTWVKHADGDSYAGRWYRWILRPGQRLFRLLWGEAREDPNWKFHSGPGQKRLNLEALTDADLHAAALEAGAPLSKLIPEGLRANRNNAPPADAPVSRPPAIDHGQAFPASASLTHFRLGGMLAVLGNFAIAVIHGFETHPAEREEEEGDIPNTPPETPVTNEREEDRNVISGQPRSASNVRLGATLTTQDEDHAIEVTLAEDVKHMFYTRLGIALLLFILFWAVGSVIFMVTERWTFWSAFYFCYITFTTLGYGDLSPQTPAGRSIFVAWALLGVATMTILVSVILEAYTQGYKTAIRSEVFPAAPAFTASRSQLYGEQQQPQHNPLSSSTGLVMENHQGLRSSSPVDTFAKPSVRTVRIDGGRRSGDFDMEEKGILNGESSEASEAAGRSSVLVRVDHLRALIEITRAYDSPQLATLISHLESALYTDPSLETTTPL